MEIYLKFAENKAIMEKGRGSKKKAPEKRTKPKSCAAAESVLPAAAQLFGLVLFRRGFLLAAPAILP